MDYTRLVCTGHAQDGSWFNIKIETTSVPKHGPISRAIVKTEVESRIGKPVRDISIVRY